MAEILPAHWEQLALAGANPAEIATLRVLAEALPEGFSVVHGVHWTRAQPQRTVFGEIDFCVLAPDGGLLVIEQKNGPLVEEGGELLKQYPDKATNVGKQIHRSLDSVREKFKETNRGFALRVDYLLYCPDHRVGAINAAGLDRARIVDATRHAQLGTIVRTLLGEREALDGGALRERVRDFLLDTWKLYPDVNAFIGMAEDSYTRLAGGLATWAQRLEFTPFRLRVAGTAGSGKTQLALAEFRRAIAEGRSPLFVCFNHPLAARLRSIVPDGGRIETFHALCDQWIRASGGQPDFTDQDADFWQRMVRWAAQLPVPEGWGTGCLIVDEGQDIEPAWANLLMKLLRSDARVLWLEDPMQNLYGRELAELPGFTRLTVPVNHRSPWRIHNAIERLLGLGHESANPLAGYDPDYIDYDGPEELLARVAASIDKFIRLGFKPRDIAIVSYQGWKRSALCRLDAIGRHSLRRWTGEYDAQNRQVFTDGEIVVDSVFRFKGQQAPAVVFAEADFNELDDKARRRLFCGMTRASVAIDCVLSKGAAGALIAHL